METCKPNIYATLDHALAHEVFNTNNKNKTGIVGLVGAVKGKVFASDQAGPLFAQLKMYAVPKESCTEKASNDKQLKLHKECKSNVAHLEVLFTLHNGKENFVLLEPSGKVEFGIGAIEKHLRQLNTFEPFHTLCFYLGIEVTDVRGSILYIGIDKQRPFYVVSSLYGEHGEKGKRIGKNKAVAPSDVKCRGKRRRTKRVKRDKVVLNESSEALTERQELTSDATEQVYQGLDIFEISNSSPLVTPNSSPISPLPSPYEQTPVYSPCSESSNSSFAAESPLFIPWYNELSVWDALDIPLLDILEDNPCNFHPLNYHA